MKTQNYLINTRTKWEEPPRARHQIARALSKNSHVYFIAANKIGFPKIEIKKQCNNFYLIQPYWFAEYRFRFRLPIINELYQIWLFRKLSKMKLSNFRVINFDHTAHLIFKYFSNVIYYCNDEYLKLYLAKSRLVLKYYRSCEKKVIRESKFCIGVTQYLVNKLLEQNKESYHIPLGGPNPLKTLKLFTENLTESNDFIAFVGYIHHGQNKDWLEELANRKPSMEIRMIGPVDKKYKEDLSHLENIIFEGVKTGDELLQVISKSKVCIAPYVMTWNINEIVEIPNKIWVYLACGKPVVTSIIPGLSVEKDFVYQSKTKEEFVENVNYAIKVDTEILEKKRVEFASMNTWEFRMKKLEEIYNKIK